MRYEIEDDSTGEILFRTDDLFEAEVALARFLYLGHDAYLMNSKEGEKQ